MAAPLLSVAGALCLPAYLEDESTPASQTILALAEITALPTLSFLDRCADTCSSLGLFAVLAREHAISPAARDIAGPAEMVRVVADSLEHRCRGMPKKQVLHNVQFVRGRMQSDRQIGHALH